MSKPTDLDEVLAAIDARIHGHDHADTPFDLTRFSLKGKSEAMKKKMLDERYVLARLAILGQMTVFYAKPNTGKTLLVLWLLMRAIKAGEIDPENVFYINADDNFKGLVHKLELAEQYGFHMLAPGFESFNATDFLPYLGQMIKQGDASGKIIILDTLKKFTDLMDKSKASAFGQQARAFVAQGGTLIALAHTNKNRDADNKVVFGGTSDIVDDADCAYTLDATEDTGTQRTVIFENIKSRGDVDREAAYRYSLSPKNYAELIASVEAVGNQERQEARQKLLIRQKLDNNSEAIVAIIESIKEGVTLKTELIEHAAKASGISKARIGKVLRAHSGRDTDKGHRWRECKGETPASKVYRLIDCYETNTDADSYLAASEGE